MDALPIIRQRLHAIYNTADAIDGLLADAAASASLAPLTPDKAAVVLVRLQRVERHLARVADELGAAVDPVSEVAT